MTLKLGLPNTNHELKPRITVVGVGGAGGNAVSNMIRANLEGVEFMVANTDSQALAGSLCDRRIQLGSHVTQGLGAGSRPDIGRAAAEEVLDSIVEQFAGANMVFITAGMGGGTGTGAAPVIARAAREHGILTVGVITKPFHFEGLHRMRIAEGGIADLQQFVDTLIIIPNQNLFRVANEKTTFADAFKMADDVLYSGVRGVTDLMVKPGLINLDFADIRAVMTEMGKAMMGTGEMEGPNRAVAAAEAAISNPLLDDVSMKGARALLINITGGDDMTLFELDEAANRIRDEVDPEANIIVGAAFDGTMQGRMRITVVATGIDAEAVAAPRPATLSLVASGGRKVAGSVASHGAAAVIETAARAEPVRAPAYETVAEPVPPSHAATATAAMAMSRIADRVDETASEMPEDRPNSADRAPMAAHDRLTIEPEDRPFIAPRAVHAAPSASSGGIRETVSSANPDRRGPSLFWRVTGGAAAVMRAGVDLLDRQGEMAPQAAVPQPKAKTSPAAQKLPREPQPTATVVTQPRLSGLDHGDRAGGEEDLLDIPAFLRRQAN